MRSLLRILPLSLPLVALPSILAAQPADSAGAKTGEHKAAKLFRATEPVAVWLIADFKTVFKDRDSMSTKRYPAKLRFLGEAGDTVSLDVELSTRGHFRLRTCEFVPLKVHFNKEQTKGTAFGGESSLKLGTHCKNGDRYIQNTYVEYAANRMYNLLTPLSLKVRLSKVTWEDPKDPKRTVTAPGIWFQDQGDLAKELRAQVVMQQGGTGATMESRQMALNDVFQYFIGNTDWSVWALHNYRVLSTDTSSAFTAMAYDFDWSGLVNAPYAFPDYRLKEKYKVTKVTDRLYRSVVCYPPEVLNGVMDTFRTRKEELYGTLRDVPELSPKRLQEAVDYLEEFYKEINDPKTVKRVFEEPCRKP
ncbi:MAG: hypothetical protein ACT4PM_12310 [Gemmatimonadales bacterium]